MFVFWLLQDSHSVRLLSCGVASQVEAEGMHTAKSATRLKKVRKTGGVD